MELNLQNFNFNIDTFFIIEAFAVSFFLKLVFEIDVKFSKIIFTIYIFNIKLFGLKYEQHKILQKIITELIPKENYFLALPN